MSFIDRTKEFFGLAPMDVDADDAYYDDEPRYETNGAAAYAPRTTQNYEPRSAARAAQQEDLQPTIVAVSLTDFNEAQGVGEPFRDGDVVVFELTDAENKIAKRIIDFAAGLCFGLRGSMRNLTKDMNTARRVFAIIPERTKVSTFDLERAAGLR